jgi:hypothetical protein
MALHLGFLVNLTEYPTLANELPHVSVNVQVWDDREHLGTVSMLDILHFEHPDLPADCPLELWATRMSRIVTRMLEDNYMEILGKGELTRAKDFNTVTAVTVRQE